MAKLPNVRESLDAVVAFLDGRDFGEAELVAVSDLTNPSAVDPKGVPWKAHVMKDYSVQRAAVAAGVLRKDLALPPHFAFEILKGNDPGDDNYSVMALEVQSPKRIHGIEAIGIIRPDVVYFEDGEPHVKLWFNALVDPQYNRGINRAYLTTAGTPLVADFLFDAAMQRVRPVAGDGALVFSADIDSQTVNELVGMHGFEVLLRNVKVPSLPERRKSLSDTAADTATLLVRPSQAYRN